MAKISTYPLADVPLQLSDRLIGTEAFRPVPSPTPLATKNFSLGELLQLFSSNFPAATLQAVLDAGNTATQNITLTGTISTTLIKPVNIEDTSGSQGLTFQVLSKGTSSINWVNIPIDNLQAVLNAGNTATQNITIFGDITSTNIIPGNIKDETGSYGLAGQVLSKTSTGLKWIVNPTSLTPGLADVTSVGNITTLDIYANSFYTNTGYALMDDGTVIGETFQFPATLSYFAYYGAGFNLWEFPDQSGTIALLSDITAATNLDAVLNNGNVSQIDAKVGDIYLYNTNAPSGNGYVYISGDKNRFNFYNNANVNLANISQDTLTLIDSVVPTRQFQIKKPATIGATRTATFQDASGTVAYLSDIPTGSITGSGTINYLPRFSPTGTQLSDSKVSQDHSAGAVYISYTGRSLINGNSMFSLQRNQSQIDFVLGNPGFSQPSYIVSDNQIDGFEIQSKGEFAIKTGATYANEGLRVLSDGKLRFTQTPDVGTTSDFMLLRDTSGNLKQTAYTSLFPLTTKGDLYTFDTAPARLPVGLNTQVLIADSTQPTGLRWGSNTAPTPLGYYGQYFDYNNQNATINNVGVPMRFGTLDLSNGITVVSDGVNLTRITFANSGVYNLQFSTQFENDSNAPQDIFIWLRKNGVTSAADVPGSTGTVGMEPRKNPGDPYHTIVTWNFLLDIVAGDFYQIVWATTDVVNVGIRFNAGSVNYPSTASTLFTVTQQSGIMAGTGVTNVSAVMSNPSQTVVVTNPTTIPQITIDDTNFMYNKFMVNQYGYLLPSDVNLLWDSLRVGGTLLTTGTVSALAENPMGQQFTTAIAVGSVTGFFGTNFNSSGILGSAFAFDFSYRFRINTNNGAQRFFAGLSNMYATATPTNIEPTAMINSIGVAKLQGSPNLFFIWNDATGTASSLDLGSGFLGTDTASTYRIRIWKSSNVPAINLQLTKVVNSTGVVTTTSVLTITSDYNTGVNHHAAIWMGNNTAVSGAVSFKNYGCELSKRNVINA